MSKRLQDINALLVTLDKIPVSGRENLERMLGCMEKLDEMKGEELNANVQTDYGR